MIATDDFKAIAEIYLLPLEWEFDYLKEDSCESFFLPSAHLIIIYVYYFFSLLIQIFGKKNTGEVFKHYHLSHNTYIPMNLTKKIYKVKQSMMENGIERFFWSLAKHKARISFAVDVELDNESERANKILGLNQFFFFFLLYAIQMGTAIMVFIIELIVHRLKTPRSCKTARTT